MYVQVAFLQWIECFDMRTRSSVGRIDVVAPARDIDQVAILLPNMWLFVLIASSTMGKGKVFTQT